MSELCRFHGVIIRMFPGDHGPAHFHAVSGGDQALVDIEAMRIYRGRLSPRLEREVLRWAEVRQTELRVAWRRTQSHEPLDKIAPPD